MKRIFSFNKLSKFMASNHSLHKPRSICTTSYNFQIATQKVNQPKEIQIDVPWGHISGKWYGPENVRPVLMFHGWQDNAGTFNTLIPKLPQHLSYLSIDFPGHGLSSRFPHGIMYSTMSYIHTINHIRRHFKWDQLSLCSHSMGAILSHLYGMMYPKYCEFVIGLDAILKPRVDPIEDKIGYYRKLGDDFLSLDQLNRTGKEPPTYTYDECVKRWTQQTRGLTPSAAEHLMERGICQSKANPNRFYFSRDIRLKIIEFAQMSVPETIQSKLMEEMKVPFLFIKANKTDKFEGMERYQQVFDTLKANNPNFKLISVIGCHHVHLTDPSVVSQQISDFINKYRPPQN